MGSPHVFREFDLSNRQFWWRHLAIPAIAFLGLALLFELSDLDLWLANILFQWEGGDWSLRHNWLTYRVFHHDGKFFIVGIGLLVVALGLVSWRKPAWAHWRMPLLYLLTCMILSPSIIALIKHFSQVPCPWDLVNYGASKVYLHNLQYPVGAGHGGHCFPSGHASGGFALLALYFAAYPRMKTGAWLFLLPGLITGFAFGIAQQLRGAHFLSHDVWAAFLTWFMLLFLFGIFQIVSSAIAARKSPVNEIYRPAESP